MEWDFPNSLQLATAMGTEDSSVECSVLYVRVAAFAWDMGLGGLFAETEGAARIAESPGSTAIGHDPEAADTREADGTDLEQEAPDELVRDERRGSVAGPVLSRLFRPPGADGNLSSIEGQDAPVAVYDSKRREACRR